MKKNSHSSCILLPGIVVQANLSSFVQTTGSGVLVAVFIVCIAVATAN